MTLGDEKEFRPQNLEAESHSTHNKMAYGNYSTVLLRAALRYAELGWKVFPCRPLDSSPGAGDAKRPLTSNGFKDATTDHHQISQWWTQWPHAMIGLALPANVVVIDLDPRDGGTLDALEELNGGPLPDTWVTQSGRGDGAHYWFTIRKRDLKQRTIGPGIDSRIGGKGYMIVPPSLHPATGRPYRWIHVLPVPAPLPQALQRRLEPVIRRPRPPHIGHRLVSPLKARRGLDGLIRTVETAQEGERNNKFFWAACRMAEREQAGLPVDWDALVDAGTAGGQDVHALTASIQSAKEW